jgi:hypothetical protein
VPDVVTDIRERAGAHLRSESRQHAAPDALPPHGGVHDHIVDCCSKH